MIELEQARHRLEELGMGQAAQSLDAILEAASYSQSTYLSDPLAANLFFQLVSARYEKGSMILTSNKSIGEWDELMGDPVLATAVLDRLLHHCHVINIRGNSYRLKDKLKTGIYLTQGTKAGQFFSGSGGSN